MAALTKEFENRKGNRSFYEVRLDGSVLKDSRDALREIARQLAIDLSIEDITFTSVPACFEFSMKLFKGHRGSMPIIFILENFDMFVDQEKQDLLYVLLDATRNDQNPVAVIGSAQTVDFSSKLEKRIKSRLSNAFIVTCSPENYENYLTIIKSWLLIPDDLTETDFGERFNDNVETLFERDPFLIDTLRKFYETTGSLAFFHNIFYLCVCSLSPKQPFLDPKIFAVHFKNQKPANQKFRLLQESSILELALIVAMKKLRGKGRKSFNFEMIHEEYENLGLKADNQLMEISAKPVAFKAFENLRNLEIVYSDKRGNILKEFEMMSVIFTDQEITDAVSKRDDCPTVLKKWATQWVE